MIGAIIKRNRLEQNLSQSSLCQGICAVSYLSKIETGRVQANDEIIELLLKELNIGGNVTLEEKQHLKELVNGFYNAELYGRFDEMKAIYLNLNRYKSYLENSLLMIDWLLIEKRMVIWLDDCTNLKENLDEYVAFFNSDNRFYYAYLKGLLKSKEGHLNEALLFYQEALNIQYKGLVVCKMLQNEFLLGHYVHAVRLGEEGYQLLVEEGNLYYMIEALQLLAAAYANLNQVSLSIKAYERLLNMGIYLKDENILYNVYYNIGATYLVNASYTKAKQHLKNALLHVEQPSPWQQLMTYQKLILCEIGLKDFQTAQAMLQEVDQRLVGCDIKDKLLLSSFKWLSFFKLSNKPYDDPEYLEAIRETYNLSIKGRHHGYKMFYGKYLIEALKAQRRYKEALEINDFLKV